MIMVIISFDKEISYVRRRIFQRNKYITDKTCTCNVKHIQRKSFGRDKERDCVRSGFTGLEYIKRRARFCSKRILLK